MTENGTSRELWPGDEEDSLIPETFNFGLAGVIEFTFDRTTAGGVDVYAEFFPAGNTGGEGSRKVAEFDGEDEARHWVYSLDTPTFTWQQAQLAFDEAATLFESKIREAAERRAAMRIAYAAHYREHPEDLGEHNPYL